MAEVKVYTEIIDDIPLLFDFMQQMGIQRILDSIVNPHGNRQGLSVGWLTTAWLSYIVSESDHRMMEVESWAQKHLETLSALLPQSERVNVKDFTDDRLADILKYLSQDKVWEEVEDQLGGHLVSVALGYETTRTQQSGKQEWEERVLVVYSPSLARNARRGLEQRLANAQSAILALTPPKGRGKRQKTDLETLEASVSSILKKHRVEGLLEVSYVKEEQQRSVRGYNGQPGRIEKSIRYVAGVQRNQQAISQARRSMGWRLYATSANRSELPFSRAVNVFRGSPRIERDFSRLKGRPLGISPLYVQRDDHVCGMLRLLSLALRVLTLVEHVVRKGLQSSGESLDGLYAGNPKRETAKYITP